MTDGQSTFGKSVKTDQRTYDNIQKATTGQGDDYTTSFQIDYHYFNEHCKMIAIDLSIQQELDGDLKTTNFTRNLDRNENTTMILITEEAKETALDFSNDL